MKSDKDPSVKFSTKAFITRPYPYDSFPLGVLPERAPITTDMGPLPRLASQTPAVAIRRWRSDSSFSKEGTGNGRQNR